MSRMDITDPRVESYIQGLLARHDEPVLVEMEAEAKQRGFPIVGRMVGIVIEILARSIGARRVFELGSGYGYSAYWFSRAVGPGGEVHLTDGDADNEPSLSDVAEPLRPPARCRRVHDVSGSGQSESGRTSTSARL